MMRPLPLVCLLFIAGFLPVAARAADCADQKDIRLKAECIHDTLKPDVIKRLLALALSTLHGRSASEPPSDDFLYIAEEAGEAARRTTLQPVIALTTAKDTSKVIFAARAITSFLDLVEHGYSHTNRFNHTGDPTLFAKARKKLPGPCKRLAEHENAMAQAEGKRCLDQINPNREALLKLFSEPNDKTSIKSIKPVPLPPPGAKGIGGIGIVNPRATLPKKNDK